MQNTMIIRTQHMYHSCFHIIWMWQRKQPRLLKLSPSFEHWSLSFFIYLQLSVAAIDFATALYAILGNRFGSRCLFFLFVKVAVEEKKNTKLIIIQYATKMNVRTYNDKDAQMHAMYHPILKNCINSHAHHIYSLPPTRIIKIPIQLSMQQILKWPQELIEFI